MQTFLKFHGAGNDFILIEDFDRTFPISLVPKICDRRLGVGADGLILASYSRRGDFEMIFFNSDGSRPDFCGNGLRCFVHFLQELGYHKSLYKIEIAGKILTVKCKDLKIYTYLPKPKVLFWDVSILNFRCYGVRVGVPHIIVFADSQIDVEAVGARLRNHKIAGEDGANVNFISEIGKEKYQVRTFERGIEGETLSCGSGIGASAFVLHKLNLCKAQLEISTRSGELFEIDIGDAIGICGPSKKVFEGKFSLFSGF